MKKININTQDIFWSTLYVFVVTLFVLLTVAQIREYGVIGGILSFLN